MENKTSLNTGKAFYEAAQVNNNTKHIPRPPRKI